MSELFAPVCSITTTRRRRFFWVAWWTAPPRHVPFRKPDAEGGAASSFDEALEAAERAAGRTLIVVDALWARAWLRTLRGQDAWPNAASRVPRSTPAVERLDAPPALASIWTLLRVSPEASDAELKAAYRRRALETHPDHGGDADAFRRVLLAYEEARRRIRKPRRRR